MTNQLFVDLTEEWAQTARSMRAVRAVRRWKQVEPALVPFRDLWAITRCSLDGRWSDRDAVMGALLRVGETDPLALRTVFQIVLPGLACIARYYVPGPVDEDDVAAAVVEAAWTRISSYPLDRRPAQIAVNIVLDTRQTVSRRIFRQSNEVPSSDLVMAHEAAKCSPDPTLELLKLLSGAVSQGIVSLDDARLVAMTRVQDRSFEELAEGSGLLPNSFRRRRLRAEVNLALAVA